MKCVFEMCKRLVWLQFVLFFGVALSSCSIPKYNHQALTKDLVFLKAKLVAVHPDPFFSLSEADFDRMLDSVSRLCVLQKKISQKHFFSMINPVVASLNDGHTRLEVPGNITRKGFFWGSKVLPLALKFTGDDAYLLYNLDEKHPVDSGSRIVSINGVLIDSIVTLLEKNHYGRSRLFRRTAINAFSFPRELWLFGNMNKLYSVEYVTPRDERKRVFLQGVSQPRFYGKVGEYINAQPDLSWGKDTAVASITCENGFYSEIVSGKLAVIKYTHCGGAGDTLFINNAFRAAKKSMVANLVLDLRGNPGGSTRIYDAIVAHLSKDTIRYFSKIQYRLSSELLAQKPFGSNYPYPDSSSVGALCNLVEEATMFFPQGHSDIFTGRFYLLCDAGTFSTASGFCAVIQDNHLGTLVGQPTGGMGSSFGNYLVFILPNSKIPFVISASRYYRPSGDAKFSPVVPDVLLPDVAVRDYFTRKVLD